jgi:hypothetical protein
MIRVLRLAEIGTKKQVALPLASEPGRIATYV